MRVVVVEESHKPRRIWIEKILGKHFVDCTNAMFPSFSLFHRFLHGEVPGEVNGAIQAGFITPSKAGALDNRGLLG